MLYADVRLGVDGVFLGPRLEEHDDHLLLFEHLVVALGDALLGVLGLVVLDVPVAKGVAVLVGLEACREDLTVLLEADLELLGCD